MDHQTIQTLLILLPSALGLLAAVVGLVNRAGIKNVHETFNSKMDKLLELTKLAALAEGRLNGIDEEKAKQAIRREGAESASVGPQGAPGETGEAGPRGQTGAIGAQGLTGPQGPTGRITQP